MWKTEPSSTTNISLQDLLDQFKNHPHIDAILLMGSAVNQTMNEFSDIDLAVIVKELPENFLGINTCIDNKFSEIFFYTTAEVNEILTKEIIDLEKKEGWIINWARDGKIIVDKSGLLEKVKAKSAQIKDNVVNTSTYIYWHKINYNYVQNIRYFKSGKEIYLQALGVRLLYSMVEVVIGYFNLRNIVWRGEKQAIKWLQKNDPEFLKDFQQYIIETDRTKKIELYRKLAEKALEPVGGLWEDKVVSIVPAGELSEQTIERGLQFWNSLLDMPS